MLDERRTPGFAPLDRACNAAFRPGRQAPDRAARRGDGRMTCPRGAAAQARAAADHRRRIAEAGLPDKPVMRSLCIDLRDRPEAPPRPIRLGFRSGADRLRGHLRKLRSLGINLFALNPRLGGADTEATMRRLADEILPEFSN